MFMLYNLTNKSSLISQEGGQWIIEVDTEVCSILMIDQQSSQNHKPSMDCPFFL